MAYKTNKQTNKHQERKKRKPRMTNFVDTTSVNAN